MQERFADCPHVLVKNVSAAQAGRIGTGLFSSNDFASGEVILKLDWRNQSCAEIVPWEETDEEHQDRATAIAPHWYFFPRGAKRIGRKAREHHPLWFLNHSCHPNLGYHNWARPEAGSVVPFVALREIKAGDQLTIDYSTMTTSDDGEEEGTPWMMQCLCGEANCRGQLTAFARLSRDLQLKMVLNRKPVTGIIPAFIVNESPHLVKELARRAPDLHESFLLALGEQRRLARRFKAEYQDN